MLINEIEKKYRARVSHSDCQKLQICEYLIFRTTNIFESLHPLSFSFYKKVTKTCYYLNYHVSQFYI